MSPFAIACVFALSSLDSVLVLTIHDLVLSLYTALKGIEIYNYWRDKKNK